MRFEHSVVVGTGKLALACAVLQREHGVPVCIYDTGEEPSGFLESGAKRAGIDCAYAGKGKQLFRALAETEQETLLVSAINPRILPGYLVANEHIYAVNCHQALLPAHPGRNAELWAIYEGDDRTGITWHRLDASVDGGALLLQKSLPITETSTSYQIFREQIALAEEAFRELLPQLLQGTEQPVLQNPEEKRTLHYSWEVPNDGVLDPAWTGEKMSRFLRAMDYSILKVMPAPKILLDGTPYIWKKYRITRTGEAEGKDEMRCLEDSIVFWKQGLQIELKGVKQET